MNITKHMNGKELVVAPEGRLDTKTASELEEALMGSIDEAESLVLDFAKLDYISSAGLRVLLTANTAMSAKGGMKVINVNDLVQEVFKLTSFTALLTIE